MDKYFYAHFYDHQPAADFVMVDGRWRKYLTYDKYELGANKISDVFEFLEWTFRKFKNV